MLNSISFRKDTLAALEAKAIRYEIEDLKSPGLRLTVFPSGIKTYYLLRRVNGRSQRIKIGRFADLSVEQARHEAGRLKALITLGNDPHEEKKAERQAITFKELAETYYTEHALKLTKRPKDNKRSIELHLLPVFGNQKLSNITPDRIRKLHASIGENRGKGTANRVFSIVRAIFNFAIREGIYNGQNPCTGLVRFKQNSRDRFLSKEELKKFFKAIEMENELFEDFFALLLFTGARKSNVLSMKWQDIDLSINRWRISEKNAKNKDVNIVSLSGFAIEILERRYKFNKNLKSPSLFVFPGESKDGHLKDPKKAFTRVKKRMEIEDFRMHDLRRTLGSYMAISGASLLMIGKALSHKSHRSTEIYARLSNEPVLEAVNIAAMTIRENELLPVFKMNAEFLNDKINSAIKFSALAA